MPAKKMYFLCGRKKGLKFYEISRLKKNINFIHEKTEIFAQMSVKACKGGGLKALADMSLKNVSFFYGSPKTKR